MDERMIQGTSVQQQETADRKLALQNGNVLQRRCSCGRLTVAGGECAACRKKRLALQRRTIGTDKDPPTAPPIVREVLRAPGRPLDSATRVFMESRFGQNFSRVRVHTDTRAAESARLVNASAYTVGQDVVFGAGQYAPGTDTGQRLIAHELTHVVQQRHNSQIPTKLRVGPADDSFEAEAERTAASRGASYANSPLNTHGPQAGTLQRGPGAVAAMVGAGVLGFLIGFGAAFATDYLTMTRERAEQYGRELDTNFPGWRSRLPNCPCTPPTDESAKWVSDGNPNLNQYHPGAVYAYRSTAAATQGSRHGQQCTYDEDGRLITSGAGAGTPDVYSPSSFFNIPYHIVYDVKTWDELGWSTYNQYWVPNNGNNCPENRKP